jgi:tetratricopeptide (TPR) repeat protein
MKLTSYIILLLAATMAFGLGCSKPDGQKELESGIRELKRDNHVRAKSMFEKAIARRPGHIDNAMIHNYLGIAAWRLGKFEEAMIAFEDSRRLNPNLIEPIYNLGVLAAERDDMRGATRYLNEAATLNRTDARPLEYLAELYMQREQWTLARNALYSALDRAPRSPRIYNDIATVHVRLNQPQQALESLMMALEVNTKYAPALFNLAVVYDTLLGDPDQARAYYKRFVSAAPRDELVPSARAAIARIDERGTLVAAPVPSATATNVTDADPVIDPGLAAETMDPESVAAVPVPLSPPPPTPLAVTSAPPATPAVVAALAVYDNMLKQAEQRARSGQIQQAIDTYVRAAETAANDRRVDLQEKAYREAVRVAIDQPRAHALLGQHLYERGQYDASARAFKQSATLNDDYAPAQLGLARLAMRNSEYDAALVHFRKVIESDPTLSDAQWEFAMLYDKNLGMTTQAAKAYRDFAKNFPNDTRRAAALTRADTLAPPPKPVPPPVVAATESRSPDATPSRRIEYKPPTTRNPRAASEANSRAGLYHEQKDWDRAIYFYTRALENDDQLPIVFYNLGICYSMKGDNDLARDAYRRAIRLQPGMIDAKYNLALLYREIKDNPSAVRLLEEIVKAKPDYAAAHYALGLVMSEQPQTHARAKQHYQEFLRLAPNDRSAPVIRQWVNTH